MSFIGAFNDIMGGYGIGTDAATKLLCNIAMVSEITPANQEIVYRRIANTVYLLINNDGVNNRDKGLTQAREELNVSGTTYGKLDTFK